MKFAIALTALTLLALAVPASAQSAADANEKSHFYDMTGSQVGGDVRRRALPTIDRHSRPKWQRLFALKKSLRPALHASAAEASLK